jgi:tricorn protease-like protein
MKRSLTISCASILACICVLSGCTNKNADKEVKGGEQKTYETPQAVFDAAALAARKKDYQTAIECFTEESRNQLAEILLGAGMITRSFGRFDKTEKAQEAMKLLDGVFQKHGLTKDVLDRLVKMPRDQQSDELKKLIKDRSAFVADMMEIMPKISRKKKGSRSPMLEGNDKLVDVKIDADTATGVVVMERAGKEDRKPLKFKKERGGWKIDFAYPLRIQKQGPRVPNQKAKAGKELFTLKGHKEDVWCVAFSPDGKRLASGSHDGTVKLWDLAEGKAIRTLKVGSFLGGAVNCVAFSRDGNQLATGGDGHNMIIWDTANGEKVRTIDLDYRRLWGVAFSPDGKRLFSGCVNGEVQVWDVASGKVLFTWKERDLHSLAVSQDGQRLAAGHSKGSVTIWDAASRQKLHTLKVYNQAIVALAFSPDGKTLATGSGVLNMPLVKTWDVASGKELLTITRGHAGYIGGLAFSPDGKRLATTSMDGTARVWEAASGKELLILSGHEGQVRGVAFSPDGQRLATGSTDMIARVWQVAD